MLNFGIIKPNASLASSGLQLVDWKQDLAHHLTPKQHNSAYFNEFWSYFFVFPDMEMHIVFSTASFGRFKSPVSGARFSITNFNGNTYQIAREYDLKLMHYQRENHYLRLHAEREVWFRGQLDEQHVIRFETSKDGISYDVTVTMTEMEPGFTVSTDRFQFRGESMGVMIPTPKARATAEITINDDTKTVTGFGYIERSWQSNITPRIFHSGYRFWQTESEGWQLGYFLIPKNPQDARVLGFTAQNRQGKTSIRMAERLMVSQSRRVKSYAVAERISIELENQRELELSVTQNREVFPLLGELSGWQYRIARTFLGGEIVEFRGKASIDGSPGFYNFFIVE